MFINMYIKTCDSKENILRWFEDVEETSETLKTRDMSLLAPKREEPVKKHRWLDGEREDTGYGERKSPMASRELAHCTGDAVPCLTSQLIAVALRLGLVMLCELSLK